MRVRFPSPALGNDPPYQMYSSSDPASQRRSPAAVRWQAAAALAVALLLGVLTQSTGAAPATAAHTTAQLGTAAPTTAPPGNGDQPGTSPPPATRAGMRPALRGSGAGYLPATQTTNATSISAPTRTERAALVGLALALPIATWLVMSASERWRKRRR